MTTKLQVVGVARVSSENDGSVSVEDQIERMRDACKARGWTLTQVYEERDVSGRRPLEQRHGLKQAVLDVESGRAQVLLTAYFDRFVRSVRVKDEVLVRVEAAGGTVQTLDFGEVSNGSAMQWLSSTQHAAFSEYFSRATAERTAASKARNVAKGVPPFPRLTPAFERIPDGPDKGKLRPSKNAPLIAEAVRMRAYGASYTKILRWLDEHGLHMTQTGLETTLASKLLIGEIHFGGLSNLNAHAPIVSPSLWRQAQSAKATKGRHGKSARLLARLGVLVCGSCGSRMSVHSTTSGGKLYPYYRCTNRLCEHQAGVAAGVVEQTVREQAIRLAGEASGRASAQQELEAARLARGVAEEQYAGAIRTLANHGGEVATREVLEELQAQRDAAVAEHERLVALTTPDLTISTGADWDRLTFEEQRAVIRAVVARAVVMPGKGPGRVRVEGREPLAE